MSVSRRTLAWAGLIFFAGIAIGVLATLIILDSTRRQRIGQWNSASRIEAMLLRNLDLLPEQQTAATGPVRVAALALLAANRDDEVRDDAILHQLASNLAGVLGPQQRDELDRRLAERTRLWQTRLENGSATDAEP